MKKKKKTKSIIEKQKDEKTSVKRKIYEKKNKYKNKRLSLGRKQR